MLISQVETDLKADPRVADLMAVLISRVINRKLADLKMDDLLHP